MYYRDPKCVFVSDTIVLAHTVVSWLGVQGIEADVMNEMTLGGFEGLHLLLPERVSLRGLEVWVKDPAEADHARQLLAEHEQELRGQRSEREGTVEATCEECGQTTMFPAAEQGTVQQCPHCSAYLDVPDPTEEPDDDFADEEPDNRPDGE